jgi:hypothetical protein
MTLILGGRLADSDREEPRIPDDIAHTSEQ